MIKSFIAYTGEVDEKEAAVEEILAALNPAEKLLKHSLGIVSCYSEFEETGVLKAVCDVLPFDCIGTTTCLSSANGYTDRTSLVILVLTSDDCFFKTASVCLNDDYENQIGDALQPLCNSASQKPSLIMGYFPITKSVSGDRILHVIDAITGGVPIFGATVIDHTMDFHTAGTVCNGEVYRDSVVLGFIYGNVNYAFEVASYEEHKIEKLPAVITTSRDNVLVSISGKSVFDFFNEIGLPISNIHMESTPFFVYNNSVKPIARAIYAFTPEGHAVCAGAMPEGAALGIGRIDAADVVNTTKNALTVFIRDNCTLISYSCMTRFFVQGSNYTAEADKVSDICGDIPYLFTCTGGEICPMPDARGKPVNVYHNFTNVFCAIW